MMIYVLDDGETWTLTEPTAVAVTPEQLTRIENDENVYDVVPDWDRQHLNDDDHFFINAGIAARERLKELNRDHTKNIVEAQNSAASTDVLVEALNHLATCGSETHDHTCVDPDDPDLLMDPVEHAAKHDKGVENNEASRLRLAEAVWETLTLNDIRQQFINDKCEHYKQNPDDFDEDGEWFDLDDEGGE